MKDLGKKYTRANWEQFLTAAKDRQAHLDYDHYKHYLVDAMRDFSLEKEIELKKYYKYYQVAESKDFFDKNYLCMYEKDLKIALSQCKVLVLTANPIEKAIFHYFISTYSSEKIRRIICDNVVYFILKWGKYWVAHIPQNETGAYKDYGTNASLQHALKHFSPNTIISLGVAFGIDYESQNIGDVIVSKKILPYSENKRDEDIIKPDRNQDKSIDNWLDIRLKNAHGFIKDVTYGDILTGGSVMSSFGEKDKVCLGYTVNEFVIGGEMEGNALFQVAKTDGVPCVVIKGICDWGVAKNDIFEGDKAKEDEYKDSLQAYAMAEAVEKCKPLFTDKTLLHTPKSDSLYVLKRRYSISKASLNISLLLIGILSILALFFYEVFIQVTFYYSIVALTVTFCFLLINSGLPAVISWKFKCWYANRRMNKEMKTEGIKNISMTEISDEEK